MELAKVELLIQKFWEGETSLEEEQKLKDYFQNTEIDSGLESYASYFKYLAFQAKTKMPSSKRLIPTKKKNYKLLYKIAAAVLFVISSSFALTTFFADENKQLSSQQDTFESPEEAYQKLKETLSIVSIKLKSSKDLTKHSLKKVDKAINIIK